MRTAKTLLVIFGLVAMTTGPVGAQPKEEEPEVEIEDPEGEGEGEPEIEIEPEEAQADLAADSAELAETDA